MAEIEHAGKFVQFIPFPAKMARDGTLTPEAKAVALLLCELDFLCPLDSDEKPNTEDIAQHLTMPHDAVLDCIDELNERGYMSISVRGEGG